MRRSDLFLPATRETRGAGTAATKLLIRAGLIREFGSGLWGFTPAGQRIRQKIVDRVRAGMDALGGQEVCLPGLQYRDRWEESGRWRGFEDEMFTLTNRDGQDMCLAPSHEEGVVHLFDGHVRSVRHLPLLVYQIDSKFRDDHARNGLVRCKEFTMKDAYSVHATGDGLRGTYREVRAAYERILSDLGLDFAIVEAENSVMGGSTSEEFVTPVEAGSDRLRHCSAEDCRFGVTDEHDGFVRHKAGGSCPECGGCLVEADGIEVGHVFQLGTRYSVAMDFSVDDSDGGDIDVVMGSYGLGIDRLLQTILQQHADAAGCRWPVTDWGCIAPYRVGIVPIGYDGVAALAEDLYDELGHEDVLLFDDDTQSPGERFAECDLLGLPAKVIVGDTYRETGLVEVESREGETRRLDPNEVSSVTAKFDNNTSEHQHKGEYYYAP